MNKYAAEFIGTFFLVLTVGCAAGLGLAGDFAPIAIGSALMVMIFAGGHVSGAHFNPAVTLAVFLRGKCPATDVAPYMGAQVLTGVVAALVTTRVLGSGIDITALDLSGMTLNVFIAEFLFTFALGYVVLNTATAKGTDASSFYGLAGGAVATLAFKGINPDDR